MRDLKFRNILTIMFISLLVFNCSEDDNFPNPENPGDMPYNIEINPEDFLSENIEGNHFFPFNPGLTYVYEGLNEDEVPVKVEEIHTFDTKIIMGVTCVIIHAKEYENDELIEDTYDWYAQDNEGNMWYFGEDTKEIKNGDVISTSGSWEAGVNGSLPGIIMFANPYIGVWYRQEYYENEAEDVAQILSLSESITVPYGSFTNCLQTAEWSLLEPGVLEHKFYAENIGVVKVVAVKGESGYEELTQIIE